MSQSCIKGIKKRYVCIPPSMVIDFHNLVTYEEVVIEDGKNEFFQNDESDLSKFSLARTMQWSGI